MAELTCPVCDAPNQEGAMLCARCGSDLLAVADSGFAARGPEPGAVSERDRSPVIGAPRVVCLEPGCGYEFREEEGECRRCGATRPSDRLPGWRVTGEGIRIEVGPGDRVVMGRSGPFASQFAARDNISSTHLLLTVSDDGESVSILDLRSTNGTFINSNRLVPGEDFMVREPVQLRMASDLNLRLEPG